MNLYQHPTLYNSHSNTNISLNRLKPLNSEKSQSPGINKLHINDLPAHPAPMNAATSAPSLMNIEFSRQRSHTQPDLPSIWASHTPDPPHSYHPSYNAHLALPVERPHTPQGRLRGGSSNHRAFTDIDKLIAIKKIGNILHEVDEDSDGEIDFEEFREGIKMIDNDLLQTEIKSIYDHCVWNDADELNIDLFCDLLQYKSANVDIYKYIKPEDRDKNIISPQCVIHWSFPHILHMEDPSNEEKAIATKHSSRAPTPKIYTHHDHDTSTFFDDYDSVASLQRYVWNIDNDDFKELLNKDISEYITSDQYKYFEGDHVIKFHFKCYAKYSQKSPKCALYFEIDEIAGNVEGISVELDIFCDKKLDKYRRDTETKWISPTKTHCVFLCFPFVELKNEIAIAWNIEIKMEVTELREDGMINLEDNEITIDGVFDESSFNSKLESLTQSSNYEEMNVFCRQLFEHNLKLTKQLTEQSRRISLLEHSEMSQQQQIIEIHSPHSRKSSNHSIHNNIINNNNHNNHKNKDSVHALQEELEELRKLRALKEQLRKENESLQFELEIMRIPQEEVMKEKNMKKLEHHERNDGIMGKFLSIFANMDH